MKVKISTMLLLVSMSALFFSFKSDDKKPKAKPGTYQFIVYNTKQEIMFSEDTFIYIEEKRKESEDITINLNPYMDVFIPSKKSIESTSFQALPEYHYK